MLSHFSTRWMNIKIVYSECSPHPEGMPVKNVPLESKVHVNLTLKCHAFCLLFSVMENPWVGTEPGCCATYYKRSKKQNKTLCLPHLSGIIARLLGQGWGVFLNFHALACEHKIHWLSFSEVSISSIILHLQKLWDKWITELSWHSWEFRCQNPHRYQKPWILKPLLNLQRHGCSKAFGRPLGKPFVVFSQKPEVTF